MNLAQYAVYFIGLVAGIIALGFAYIFRDAIAQNFWLIIIVIIVLVVLFKGKEALAPDPVQLFMDVSRKSRSFEKLGITYKNVDISAIHPAKDGYLYEFSKNNVTYVARILLSGKVDAIGQKVYFSNSDVENLKGSISWLETLNKGDANEI